MRVMRLADSPDTGNLVEANVRRPNPGPGQVLVRVYATGVTPGELQWYPSSHTKAGELRERPIPGHEFSGVIAELGDGVAGLDIGQAVYGMNDWFADGATAEFCLAEPNGIAPKPLRSTHVEAASVPIAALTAWQGLFSRARLQPGQRVLVHGGSGAVGAFAVQLAHHRGAHVSATCSTPHCPFVTELGATQVIDYRESRFENHVDDINVVFDTVGGETLERSWRVLAKGGRMITVATESSTDQSARVQEAFFIVKPNRDQLVEIGALLEAGVIRPTVREVVPFSDAPAAYSGGTAKRRGRGKVVVGVADDHEATRRNSP